MREFDDFFNVVSGIWIMLVMVLWVVGAIVGGIVLVLATIGTLIFFVVSMIAFVVFGVRPF